MRTAIKHANCVKAKLLFGSCLDHGSLNGYSCDEVRLMLTIKSSCA